MRRTSIWVAATIGTSANRGPDCACVRPAPAELPMAAQRMIGASCTLGAGELKQRLADWRSLRDRATNLEPIAEAYA